MADRVKNKDLPDQYKVSVGEYGSAAASGAAVGGAVGGPVGAAVGAGVGLGAQALRQRNLKKQYQQSDLYKLNSGQDLISDAEKRELNEQMVGNTQRQTAAMQQMLNRRSMQGGLGASNLRQASYDQARAGADAAIKATGDQQLMLEQRRRTREADIRGQARQDAVLAAQRREQELEYQKVIGESILELDKSLETIGKGL